jgi:hypothetical protein
MILLQGFDIHYSLFNIRYSSSYDNQQSKEDITPASF